MKKLSWYLSHVIDPYSDDSIVDQGDLNEYWYLQYKCDSILNSIGTKSSRININIFLSEIEVQLDEESIRYFYKDVFKKLISVYHMWILEDHCDEKIEFDYVNEIKKLLIFCEKPSIVTLSQIIKPIFDVDIKFTEQYIKENFSKLNIKDVISKIDSELISYFFTYSPLKDICFFLYYLVQREITDIEAYLLTSYLNTI